MVKLDFIGNALQYEKSGESLTRTEDLSRRVGFTGKHKLYLQQSVLSWIFLSGRTGLRYLGSKNKFAPFWSVGSRDGMYITKNLWQKQNVVNTLRDSRLLRRNRVPTIFLLSSVINLPELHGKTLHCLEWSRVDGVRKRES